MDRIEAYEFDCDGQDHSVLNFKFQMKENEVQIIKSWFPWLEHKSLD